MPTKYSTVIAVRVKNDTLRKIQDRLRRRNITLNAWLNLAILQGLRKHRRKNDGNNPEQS